MGEVNRVTNAKFAKENEEFREACEKAGVELTTRQASKYRNKKGRAWKAHRRMWRSS